MNFDVCKETQEEHTYTLNGLKNSGGGRWLLSGIISLLANGWAFIQGGGGALPCDFTVYTFRDEISVSQDIKHGDKQFKQLAHVVKISAQPHKCLSYACIYSLQRYAVKSRVPSK